MDRIRVLIEQRVIPHYRVPFFSELAKHVDLTVVVNNQERVDGISQATGPFSFTVIPLEEVTDGPLCHPALIRIIQERHVHILVSWSSSLMRILQSKEIKTQLKKNGTKLIWFGCDGYKIRHFYKKVIHDFAPWRVLAALNERVRMRTIDHFIAYSTRTASFWHTVYQIPERKISIGHNAIETSSLEAYYQRQSEQAPKSPGRAVVFTGRITPGKRLDVLIRAFARVCPIYPDATLTIIGDGAERKSMEMLVHELHITQNVIFVGEITNDADIAPFLYKSSVCVMPGLGGLGFNTMMAIGLPVIFTHADGTEDDLIEEGKQGWFFDGSVSDLVRALTVALKDPEELIRMGANAHTRITTKFTLKQMVRAYVEAITKTYAGDGHGHL